MSSITATQRIRMMEVSQGMVYNAFEERVDQIQQLLSGVFSKGGRHTFLIHLGDNLTIHSHEEDGGVTTQSVGDADGVYAHIIDNGTGLTGLVSVHMSVITEIVGSQLKAEIVLEVYPVRADDEPLVGLIWLDDIQMPGMSPFGGSCIVWSASQFQIPGPRFPVAITNNTLQGFTLGMDVWDEAYDSIQIIGQLMRSTQFMTPMGASIDKVEDIYPLSPAKELSQPEDMKPLRFNILKVLFKSGISIFNEDAAREIFAQHFPPEEAAKLVTILHHMARNDWFVVNIFRDKAYFIPTPKLLVAIQ